MPSFGQSVRVTEFGKEYRGLVVKSRILDHHLGANDEPLLTAIVVKPVIKDECVNCGNRQAMHGKPAPQGYRVCGTFVAPDPVEPANPLDYVHVIADIPHESHKFSDADLDALQKKGISVGIAYPGGVHGTKDDGTPNYVGAQIPGPRWSELDAVAAAPAPETPNAPAVEAPAANEPPAGGDGSGTIQ